MRVNYRPLRSTLIVDKPTLAIADPDRQNGIHGVSVHSKPFFAAFPKGHLDRFETRKVIFGCPGALDNPEAAFLRAIEFEILWLKNKRDYYGAIHREDEKRIVMMEERYRKAIQTIEATTV